MAYNRKQNELELSEENKNNTLSLLNAISNLVSISEEVINRLSIKITITPYNIGKIFEIITLIKNKPIFQPTWFDNGIVCNALQNIDKYQNICNEINAIVNKISEKWEKEIISIDSDSILNRFKTEYRSIFKIFKLQYRTDKKRLFNI